MALAQKINRTKLVIDIDLLLDCKLFSNYEQQHLMLFPSLPKMV